MRLLLLIIVLANFSCKGKKGYVDKQENGGDEVFTVKSEDQEMNQAIAKAKATFPDFIAVLKTHDSTYSGFVIKMKFDYGENSGEHMWLSELYFDQDSLFGVLASDPIYVKTVSSGDSLPIHVTKLSDWMYIKDGKMNGGYTIKALYDKMGEAEKKEFRDQFDFEIE